MINIESKIIANLAKKADKIIPYGAILYFPNSINIKYTIQEGDTWFYLYMLSERKLEKISFEYNTHYWYEKPNNTQRTMLENYIIIRHTNEFLGIIDLFDRNIARAILNNDVKIVPENKHDRIINIISSIIEEGLSLSKQEIHGIKRKIWREIHDPVTKIIELHIEKKNKIIIYNPYRQGNELEIRTIGGVITENKINRIFTKHFYLTKLMENIKSDLERITERRIENIIRALFGIYQNSI